MKDTRKAERGYSRERRTNGKTDEERMRMQNVTRQTERGYSRDKWTCEDEYVGRMQNHTRKAERGYSRVEEKRSDNVLIFPNARQQHYDRRGEQHRPDKTRRVQHGWRSQMDDLDVGQHGIGETGSQTLIGQSHGSRDGLGRDWCRDDIFWNQEDNSDNGGQTKGTRCTSKTASKAQTFAQQSIVTMTGRLPEVRKWANSIEDTQTFSEFIDTFEMQCRGILLPDTLFASMLPVFLIDAALVAYADIIEAHPQAKDSYELLVDLLEREMGPADIYTTLNLMERQKQPEETISHFYSVIKGLGRRLLDVFDSKAADILTLRAFIMGLPNEYKRELLNNSEVKTVKEAFRIVQNLELTNELIKKESDSQRAITQVEVLQVQQGNNPDNPDEIKCRIQQLEEQERARTERESNQSKSTWRLEQQQPIDFEVGQIKNTSLYGWKDNIQMFPRAEQLRQSEQEVQHSRRSKFDKRKYSFKLPLAVQRQQQQQLLSELNMKRIKSTKWENNLQMFLRSVQQRRQNRDVEQRENDKFNTERNNFFTFLREEQYRQRTQEQCSSSKECELVQASSNSRTDPQQLFSEPTTHSIDNTTEPTDSDEGYISDCKIPQPTAEEQNLPTTLDGRCYTLKPYSEIAVREEMGTAFMNSEPAVKETASLFEHQNEYIQMKDAWNSVQETEQPLSKNIRGVDGNTRSSTCTRDRRRYRQNKQRIRENKHCNACAEVIDIDGEPEKPMKLCDVHTHAAAEGLLTVRPMMDTADKAVNLSASGSEHQQ